jgi:hypothetical protein
MDPNNTQHELAARLSLIETMIAEGRQKTESWGWTFVLWGAAYAGAIISANVGTPVAEWTTWGHHTLAWPICIVSAFVVMFAYIMLAGRKSASQPDTTMGRAVFSLWIAMGISLILLLQALGASGKLDQHIFVAVVASLLGMTNAASSLILKWRLQFACAVVWWATAVSACFVSVGQSTIIFLVAIFLCQIVFGIYGMISEARQIRAGASGAAHA